MKMLGVREGTILEVIVGSTRMGVKAFVDYSGFENPLDKSEEESVGEEISTTSEDVAYPTPRGLPFVGDLQSDKKHAFPARVDGEVRQSLGVALGDLVEVDTILKPNKARTVLLSILGVDNGQSFGFLLKSIADQQNGLPLSRGLVFGTSVGFKEYKTKIEMLSPDEIVVADRSTVYEIQETSSVVEPKQAEDRLTYDEIGGFRNQLQRLRKLVEIPLRYPEEFKQVNLTPPRGILLSGPIGVGKTLLVQAVISESNANVVEVPPGLFRGVGLTEKAIRELFAEVNQAAEKEPTIFLLENLDHLSPAPYQGQQEAEKRFTSQFTMAMDTLRQENVVVVGTCHSRDAVDPAMRRAGRFDVEIEVPVPNYQDRLAILRVHLRQVPLGSDVTDLVLSSLVQRMIGFVGADIAALVKEAAINAIGRHAPEFMQYTQVPPQLLRSIKVVAADFEEAFKVVEPSALRSVKYDIPNVHWDDVGGQVKAKTLLREQVEYQFQYPEVLTEMGVSPSRGVLLYGPPGNGKTLLAKAVATEVQANFLTIKGPELLSMWFAESARMVREVFALAKRLAPSVIFFDEVDAICPKRGQREGDGGREMDSTVNQLLTLLDGMNTNQQVFVMGATNRPDALDPALLRPGRLDRLILVESPDELGRREILEVHLAKVPLEGDRHELIGRLAPLTEGFSGADLENLCREAVLTSLREDFSIRVVSQKHFDEALTQVRPSVDPKLHDYYAKFATDILGRKKLDQLKNRSVGYY